MADDIVPVEDLPEEVRGSIMPGTPAFKAYARHYEKLYNVNPGLLDTFDYQSKDPLRMLQAAAQDQSKRGPAQGATTGGPAVAPWAPPVQRPPMEYDPSKGGGSLQFGPWNTGIPTPEFVEQGLAGAGKSFADTGRGFGQLAGVTPQSAVDEAARRDAPLMDTRAGFLGNVGGNAAQMALPGMGLARAGKALPALASPYAQAALLGGAAGAAAPVESGNSRLVQAGAGAVAGLAGQGAMEAGKALATPAWRNLKPPAAELASKAVNEYGIPLSAADISENPMLKAAQFATEALPFSGAKAANAAKHSAFNRVLSGTFGEQVDNLSQALRQAKPRLGQTYDDLASRNTAVFDDGRHLQHLDAALRKYRQSDTSVNKQVSKTLDEYLTNIFFNPQNSTLGAGNKLQMPGKLYKEFRSEARSLSQTAANKGDGELAKFYREVKETLDHAMRTSASPEDAALYKLTDKQYGNMKTLEKIAPKDAHGDADFTSLANVLTREGSSNLYPRNAFIYGQGDQTLPEVAKIGTTFLGRGEPPSPWRSFGKAARGLAPAVVGTGATVGSLYSLNHGSEHPVLGTLGALGAMALGGKAAGKALNSRLFATGSPGALGALQGLERAGAARVPPAAAQSWMRGVAPPEEQDSSSLPR